jgi:hypothetical protein
MTVRLFVIAIIFIGLVWVKQVKQSHNTRTEAWWRMYSSYSFTSSALDGVRGQRHALAALNPLGKGSRYPLDKRLGGPQSLCGPRG